MNLYEAYQEHTPAIHFSIDDCIWGLQELFTTRLRSIFEVPYFAYLKSLHEKHKAVITCFLLNDNSGLIPGAKFFSLTNINNTYADEFRAQRWLRWGIHGLNQSTPMDCQSQHDINLMVKSMRHSITVFSGQQHHPVCWRPHFYAASRDACQLMQNSGVKVLLTPDDSRKTAASLRPAIVKRLQDEFVIDDPISGFLCVKSLFRCEDPLIDKQTAQRLINASLVATGIAAFFVHEHEMFPCGDQYGKDWSTLQDKVEKILTYAAAIKCTFVD